MKRTLPAFLGITLILFIGLLFQRSQFAAAATANHVVISEIQAGSSTSTEDDFIELYNPTDTDIDMSNYALVKRTSSGTESSIKAFDANTVIPAHGYYLWCNTGLNSTLACDANTSSTVSNDNSIGLRDGAVNTGALIDSVTFGTVTDALGEGTPLTLPDDNTSVERKANSASTSQSMVFGGLDESNGNGEDTENNASDFVSRGLPQSQNKASGTEVPGGGGTETPTITPTVSPTATITASPTPTLEPTATPIPTVTPSVSPTSEPSVSPTNTPSVSPTSNPTTTPSMSPTISPEPSITVSPTPMIPTPTPKVIVHGPIFRCELRYTPVRLFHITIFVPYLYCERVDLH